MNVIKGLKLKLYQSRSAWLYILIFFCAFPFLSGLYPAADFKQERIDITIYPDHIMMKGIYIYENPFPFPIFQGYSIPLPVDADNPEPVMLSAKILYNSKKPIPVRFILGQHRFNLAFGPRERIKIQVQYQQEASGENARYILTTTQPWKKPLDQGVYSLCPIGVEITSSNYVLVAEGSDIYYFKRYQFMPQYEWDFTWRAL